MKKLALVLALSLGAPLFGADQPHVIQNVAVYHEPGRYGGWPANNGIWVWGDEIVVGFMQGYFKFNERGHSIDGQQADVPRYARSLDGGLTWKIEAPPFPTDAKGRENDASDKDAPGGMDFTAPDSALTFRMVSSGQGGYSRFYYSRDRAHTWEGPYKLPHFDQKGIAARTDYIVDGPQTVTAFITASKANGREGRVFCMRTTDDGRTWEIVGWVGPEPKGYAVMPSSVRLSPTRILTTVRRMEPLPKEQLTGGVMEGDHFIDSWVTDDNGKYWSYLNKAVESTGSANGSAQSMIKLRDGRLVITYGYRSAPYGIRARISTDQGLTWGPEIMLRTDGGTWDLGYTRTAQRADGKIVTIYYFNDKPDTERYIAATIWDPGTP